MSQASENLNIEAFNIGLLISEGLQNIRSKYTKGVKLNDLTIAYTKFDNNKAYLYQDTKNEKLMKQMIAEFAIFANSFIGEYLKNTLNIGILEHTKPKNG